MRVRFADGTSRSVNDATGVKIQDALVAGVEFVRIGIDLYKATVITSVTTDSSPVGLSMKTPRLPSPTTELTVQQREDNLKRLGDMRRKFLEEM